MNNVKEELLRYYRLAVERCADSFERLEEREWRRQTAGEWTAKDCLAHLVTSQEAEINLLTRQALAGQRTGIPGFNKREEMDAFNHRALETARPLPPLDLISRFRCAFKEHLDVLESLPEAQLDLTLESPGWGRAGRLLDLFYMAYLHLPGHYQDIRRAARRKLPHWSKLCDAEETAYQMGRSFHFMPLIYWPTRANGLNASFLFTMEGRGGGQWTVHVADGSAKTHDGAKEKADIEIRTRPDVWLDLATKEINPIKAVMGRKLKLSGNIFLAMQLESLFQVT